MHQKDYDIVCLQETHSEKANENQWKNEWGGKIWYSHGQSNARGVAILCKKSFDFKPENILRDNEGRMILIKGKVEREECLIGSIYAPNKDSPQFFEQLFQKIDKMNVDRMLIGGDINTVLDSAIDRSTGTQHRNVKSASRLKNFLDNLDLIDVWREMKPEIPGYTWRHHRPYKLSERLDYFFMTASMIQFVESMLVRPMIRTDHDGVQLSL